MQTYHRRPRNHLTEQQRLRCSSEVPVQTYCRQTSDPPIATYQCRTEGALEQFEELLEEEPQYQSEHHYQRKPQSQFRDREESGDESEQGIQSLWTGGVQIEDGHPYVQSTG